MIYVCLRVPHQAARWSQIGLHRKPVALLNVKQYYDPLFKQLDAAHVDGFMSDADRNLITASSDPTEVLFPSHSAPTW